MIHKRFQKISLAFGWAQDIEAPQNVIFSSREEELNIVEKFWEKFVKIL